MLGVVVSGGALAACGSGGGQSDGGPNAANSDGGSDSPGAQDEASFDAPPDPPDASDASDEDGASKYADVYVPPPVGTQLVVGDNLSVRGVTGDSYVVYSDDAVPALYAMPLAGGAAQNLGALGSKFQIDVVGNVVFAWSNVNDANVGALSVWSSSTGAHSISSASFGIIGTASGTGDILYIANLDMQANQGDVYVAHGDGTSPVKLVTSAQIVVTDTMTGMSTFCYPNFAFAGSYVVVSYCAGTTSAATITSFLTSSWTATPLATDASDSFWADASGTKVLYTGVSGGVYVVPIGGGAATVIDASGRSGFLSADGQSAIYGTASQLVRSPVSAPSPVTLVAGSFGGWEGLSNDGRYLVYWSHYNAGAITDLFVTTTAAPATQYTLSAAQTASLVGDPFTADSTHALFATGVSADRPGSGTFNAFSIATSSSVVLGQDVWLDRAATAGKVVFNDNFVDPGGLRFGRANIEVVDTAQAAPPTRIVTLADAEFALSPAGDKIVYVWSPKPGSMAGLWVAPIP